MAPDAGLEPSRARLGSTELLLIVAFWTFVAVLTAASGILDPRGRSPQPLFSARPLALAFAQYYLWALATPLIFWLVARYGIERTTWLRRAALYLALGLVAAITIDVALGWLRFEYFASSMPGRRGPGMGGGGMGGMGGMGGGPGGPGFGAGWPWTGIRRFFFLDDLLIYAGVLAAAFARDYFLRYRARQEEAVRLHAEAGALHAQAARLEAQLADARLAALRTQLDPHFLFNTLNAVSSLVERDPRGVRRMIARLSELLRYSLERSADQEVPLAEEMRFLEQYLEIMRVRFQGRLDVDMRVAPETLDALVPSLVLQPLVENAFKHGISRLQGHGRIEIESRLDGDRLVLEVRDNGPGLAGGGVRDAEGVGLRNTRARLEQLYAAEQRLTLRPGAGGGTIAEVMLPHHTRNDLRTTGEVAAAEQ